MSETQLKDVQGWSEADIGKLADTWINTADQVVALSATEGGLQALAEQLGVSGARVRQLVGAARNALDPETLQEMEKPVDTSEFGLGVLRPPEGHRDG